MTEAKLGERVQQKRQEKGLTQEELAGRCDLDIRTIQRIEKNEVKPYFSTLRCLSKILDHDFIRDPDLKAWLFSDT